MLFAVVIAVLVPVAVLAVPVSLAYRLTWQQRLHGEATLHWLFGLVRIRLRPPRGAKPARRKKREKESTAPKAKPTRKKLRPLAALRQPAFRRRMLRFAREFWRTIKKRDLHLRIRIGLGDPADTGQLWALCGPLSGMLANIDEASIELEAEFADAVFEVDSGGEIRVIPLQLVYLVLGLLLSPHFWRGLRRMREAA